MCKGPRELSELSLYGNDVRSGNVFSNGRLGEGMRLKSVPRW
jgi:hypothetical protein